MDFQRRHKYEFFRGLPHSRVMFKFIYIVLLAYKFSDAYPLVSLPIELKSENSKKKKKKAYIYSISMCQALIVIFHTFSHLIIINILWVGIIFLFYKLIKQKWYREVKLTELRSPFRDTEFKLYRIIFSCNWSPSLGSPSTEEKDGGIKVTRWRYYFVMHQGKKLYPLQ